VNTPRQFRQGVGYICRQQGQIGEPETVAFVRSLKANLPVDGLVEPDDVLSRSVMVLDESGSRVFWGYTEALPCRVSSHSKASLDLSCHIPHFLSNRARLIEKKLKEDR
jgi:hypothetical protein